MKVSIIVPVYNVENYLRQCLDSLVNQTIKDIEIIVINDGSPDNSQLIIDEYKNKYNNVISIIKENGGQGSARNMGLDIAKGKYIGFVDSDDYVDLDMYEKMYNQAVKDKSSVVICDMSDHFEDGSSVYYDCTNYKSVFTKTPSACNKLFSKDLIDDLRFIPGIWYEDFNFTTKLLLLNPIISVIHNNFYHCNCRKVSTMNNNNSLKNLDIIVAMEDIIDFSKKNDSYNKDLMSYLIFDHILITSINRVNKQNSKEKKEVIDNLLDYCKKNIYDYFNCSFYKNISLNRKIIARLNYLHLENVSKILLSIKK